MKTGDQERGIFFSAQVCVALQELVRNMPVRVEVILCNALCGERGQRLVSLRTYSVPVRTPTGELQSKKVMPSFFL